MNSRVTLFFHSANVGETSATKQRPPPSGDTIRLMSSSTRPISQRGICVFTGSHVFTSHIHLSANDVVWHRFKSTPPPPVAQHITLPPPKQKTFRTLPPVERIPICPAAKFQTSFLGELNARLLVILPPPRWTSPESEWRKILRMIKGVERLSLLGRYCWAVIKIVMWQTGWSVWLFPAVYIFWMSWPCYISHLSPCALLYT